MAEGVALVECVPNFSDGRDEETLEAILASLRSAPGTRVLDASQDPDHDRAVVTFVAPPQHVADAAFAAIRVAGECIDLTRHAGVHPRMGATDVCPFVPLEGTDAKVCVGIAHALGARVGAELGIPVYFYGEAALRPGRRLLPDVRRGGFELLREEIGRDPDRAPDAGPSAVHPTAGAIAVGVRPFLIAFNVVLETSDLAIARGIARAVRESSGGLPGIRALGLTLESRGAVQVSVNVCDHRRTGLVRLYDEIERLAAASGVRPLESELVGLAPGAALDAEVARHVGLVDFDPRRQIIEEAVR